MPYPFPHVELANHVCDAQFVIRCLGRDYFNQWSMIDDIITSDLTLFIHLYGELVIADNVM